MEGRNDYINQGAQPLGHRCRYALCHKRIDRLQDRLEPTSIVHTPPTALTESIPLDFLQVGGYP